METFELSDAQSKKYEDWRGMLEKKKKKNKHLTYWICFSHSNGIGWAVKGVCSNDEEIDLTEYENW